MARSKTLLGFGINDVDYTVKWLGDNGKEVSLPEYATWKGMICRCYGKENKANASYKLTTVYEGWRRLSDFKVWYDSVSKSDGFVLDKDLLGKGEVYSPETCCFIPKEVNGFLINSKRVRGYHVRGNKYEACITKDSKYVYLGYFRSKSDAVDAYLKAKSEYAKELAVKWKDQIDPRAYNALMNYEVLITD